MRPLPQVLSRQVARPMLTVNRVACCGLERSMPSSDELRDCATNHCATKTACSPVESSRVRRGRCDRESLRKLQIGEIDAVVRRDERLRDESLRNQHGALSDGVVSSSDGFDAFSTVLATRADNSGHESEAGRASHRKLRSRMIGADARRAAAARRVTAQSRRRALSARVASACECSISETWNPRSPIRGLPRSYSRELPRSGFGSADSRDRCRRPSRRAAARRVTAQSRRRALRARRERLSVLYLGDVDPWFAYSGIAAVLLAGTTTLWLRFG